MGDPAAPAPAQPPLQAALLIDAALLPAGAEPALVAMLERLGGAGVRLGAIGPLPPAWAEERHDLALARLGGPVDAPRALLAALSALKAAPGASWLASGNPAAALAAGTAGLAGLVLVGAAEPPAAAGAGAEGCG